MVRAGFGYDSVVPEGVMNEVIKIEIPVEAETARLLADERRRAAIGRLVDMMVQSPEGEDLLLRLFEQTSRRARELGFTAADLEAELAAYNAERRDHD